jgi:dTDP-glucose 4,6-dehydratase
MTKFLVVGANSFSGSHFVRRVIKEGHDVVGLGRGPEPSKQFLPRLWDLKAAGTYTFHHLNLNQPLDELWTLMGTICPEIVVNFAAQGMVAQSWEHPWDWFRTNTVGLSQLLHVLVRQSSLQKYVHITTPEVYGSTEGWVKENANFAPSTPYAVSRAAGDWHVMNLVRTENFPAVLTRAANVFGPGQQLYRVIPRAFLSGFLSETFPLHGGGRSTRSFIHITDVVEATYGLCFAGVPGETYHISSNELVSIKDLVTEVASMVGVDAGTLIEEVPDRAGKDETYQLDSSKIRALLAWQETISVSQGLDQVRGWITDNLEHFRGLPRDYVHKA